MRTGENNSQRTLCCALLLAAWTFAAEPAAASEVEELSDIETPSLRKLASVQVKTAAVKKTKVKSWAEKQKEKEEAKLDMLKKYVGKFSRGSRDEYFEFYLSPTVKFTLRGRYVGTGAKFNYSYDITRIDPADEAIRFKVKGKPYRGRRIDESLEVIYPNGKKRYCPKLTPPLQAGTLYIRTPEK